VRAVWVNPPQVHLQSVDLTGNPLSDGQWHHYALVRDASGYIRLFVDGIYRGGRTLVSSAAYSVPADGLVIGQEQDDVGGQYDSRQAAYGQLAELRFWNRFSDVPGQSSFSVQS
jgi:hypothetical protein